MLGGRERVYLEKLYSILDYTFIFEIKKSIVKLYVIHIIKNKPVDSIFYSELDANLYTSYNLIVPGFLYLQNRGYQHLLLPHRIIVKEYTHTENMVLIQM